MEIKTGTLAFIGDAVYELFVRKMLVEAGENDPDKLHIEAVKYVRAESQAYAIKRLMDGFLSEDEVELVKKARNHKMPNRSRSAGMVDYKLATGLEALVGELYMNGKEDRLSAIVEEAIRVVKDKNKA
ncbi:MAG: ribonuclease III [Firmicutes bacterium]|nr:ribonuclease III [Bacillota bacterium]